MYSTKESSYDKKGIDYILIDNKKCEITVQVTEVFGEHKDEPPEEKRMKQIFSDEKNKRKIFSLPTGDTDEVSEFKEKELRKCMLKVAEMIKDDCRAYALETEIESIILECFPTKVEAGDIAPDIVGLNR